MENCKDAGRLFGGKVVLMLAMGCASDTPAETDWRIAGLATGKTMDTNPNSTSSSADNVAGLVENLVTSADPTVSLDGEIDTTSDPDTLGFQEQLKYFLGEVAAKRQPGIWVRWVAGDVQMQYYGVITGLSESGSRDDITTYSAEYKVQDASTFNCTSLVSVTGITVPESTVALDVGDTYSIVPTYVPSDATIQQSQYSSSNESVATVDYKGVITPVAAGTATIQVRSIDGGYTQTITVTVTESGS